MESGSSSVRVPAEQVAHATGVIRREFNKRIIFKGMVGYGEIAREIAEPLRAHAVTRPGLHGCREKKQLVPGEGVL